MKFRVNRGVRCQLLTVLERFDIDITHLNKYSIRFKIQKLIYLLEDLFGLDMDYNHSWYIRGPYSEDLTRDCFYLFDASDEELDKIRAHLVISPQITQKIEFAYKQVQPFAADNCRLELLASITYLKRHSSNQNKKAIKELLIKRKPLQRAFRGKNFGKAFTESYAFLLQHRK